MNLTENKLFAKLTPADQASLQKISARTELQARDVVGAPAMRDRHVYFLTSASVALLVRGPDKPGLAVGLVGPEGAVGAHFALGMEPGIFTWQVQTPGTAWCIEGPALERLTQRRPALMLTLSKYMWELAQEVAALAAFAQLNDVKPRLARWILSSYSRSRLKELTLTQLHLAEMLGVRRASITLAAVELKAQGLVEYRRGKLLVLDMPGLEAAAAASIR